MDTSEAEEFPPPRDYMPREWNDKKDVEAAIHFRDYLDTHKRVHVCAVCSRYCPGVITDIDSDTHMTPPKSSTPRMFRLDARHIPNLPLLRRDGPSNEDMPRDGHTYVAIGGVDYCLQRAAFTGVWQKSIS